MNSEYSYIQKYSCSSKLISGILPEGDCPFLDSCDTPCKKDINKVLVCNKARNYNRVLIQKEKDYGKCCNCPNWKKQYCM